ncbi:glycosyltransferase family 39 protein [Leptospira levettii]|uniref:glycosyltransferase family 39 protein n=1 Tax=Leptospira levettii TaxID=2023178 RepID=UPI0013FE35CE|nr:glycosyltransferase family 39 protein [Leptospira levettii]MCW7473009.1 glycosyltransferase family 39 protein [Leptospira levettii]
MRKYYHTLFNSIIQSFYKYKYLCIILFVTIIGFLIRFQSAFVESYWNDELFSAWVSNPNNSIEEVFRKTSIEDVHPPIYQIILWLLYSVFGYNEFTGKILSVILGTATIPVFYLLGKKLISKEFGIILATLITFNQFTYFYSTEVRSYSLILFLSTLSLLFLVKFIQFPEYTNLLVLINLMGIASLSHYFGTYIGISYIPIILSQFLNNFRSHRRKFSILKSIVIFLNTIIYLLAVLYLVKNRIGSSGIWIEQPGKEFILEYLQIYFGSREIILFIFIVSILGFIFHSLGNRHKGINKLMLGLVSGIILAYLLAYIQGILFFPVLSPRNTIILLPPILFIIGFFISKIPYSYLRFFILSIYILFFLKINYIDKDYRSCHRCQDWRGLSKFIAENHSGYEVYGLKWTSDYFNVYLNWMNSDLQVKSYHTISNLQWKKIATNQVWIIDCHTPEIEKEFPANQFNYNKIVKLVGAEAYLIAIKK